MTKDDDARNRDYNVGHGKPPKHSQFKPGESGNRAGRKPGPQNRKTILKKIANRMHRVKENGKYKRRSTLELILLVVRNQAFAGNVRAIRAYANISARYGDWAPSKSLVPIIFYGDGRDRYQRKIPSDSED